MKLHRQCLNFCRTLIKIKREEMLLMLFGKAWEASMEKEGPVAGAVLGCLCWFSLCLLETALASSFVCSRWRESPGLGNNPSPHMPSCSTSRHRTSHHHTSHSAQQPITAHPILLNLIRQLLFQHPGVPGQDRLSCSSKSSWETWSSLSHFSGGAKWLKSS